MSKFDFGYTCPEIDRNIALAKREIKETIEGVLHEACPLLEGSTLDEFVEGWTNALYKNIEQCFETVRETNERMRTDAESQIQDLHLEIDQLKQELNSID